MLFSFTQCPIRLLLLCDRALDSKGIGCCFEFCIVLILYDFLLGSCSPFALEFFCTLWCCIRNDEIWCCKGDHLLRPQGFSDYEPLGICSCCNPSRVCVVGLYVSRIQCPCHASNVRVTHPMSYSCFTHWHCSWFKIWIIVASNFLVYQFYMICCWWVISVLCKAAFAMKKQDFVKATIFLKPWGFSEYHSLRGK